MIRSFNLVLSVALLGACAACEPGPRNKNQRDSKVEQQRQQVNAVVGRLQAEVDQAALEAKKFYQDAKREAFAVQGNVERKIAQVDRAAQAYIDHAKGIEKLADVASGGAEKARRSIEGMLGYDAPAEETTPAPPAQP